MNIRGPAAEGRGISADRFAGYVASGLWTDERLGWLLQETAARNPDRPLLIYSGDTLSYRDVVGWVEHTAAGLVAAGLHRGDRLLVQLPNCLEALIYQLAAFRAGIVVAPVISIYRGHELSHIVADLRPRGVVTAAELGERRPTEEFDRLLAAAGLDAAGAAGVARWAVGPAAPGWRQSTPRPSTGAPGAAGSPAAAEPSTPRPAATVGPVSTELPEPLAADECCLILYTSGTTSAPKGVMLSSRALISQARMFQRALDLGADDCIVCTAPLSHLAGFLNGCLLPAMCGARTVIMPRWDPDEAVAAIERHRGTFCISAPVFALDVVARYEAGASPEHRLTTWCVGAAAPPPGLIERAERVGVTAFRAYGMTEASGTATLAGGGDPLDRRAGTDGRTVAGTELQAVDEQRRPLPPGQVGELRLRGPQLLLGYTDPAHTAAQIDADGWFYTGDVGEVDEDGWLVLRGRTKDIVNRGGEKFSTRDIEDAIASHPDVAMAAVVGAPDERLGEVVAAFVVLAPDRVWTGPEALLEHLARLDLAKAKRPVRWHPLDALPMTATGKIQKNKLLDLLSAQQ
jgi:acyl-CoA synthetase (AMP-forming)/AMP-acid ligase II